MRKLVYILFISVCLTSCTKCKREQIIVQGHLIDERTGTAFNPFSNAYVRLVLDEGYGYTNELGTAQVENDGFYKIMATYSKVGIKARLQLVKDENWQNNVDAHIDLFNKTNHNFIIKCSVNLKRVYFQQTASNVDSVIISVTNSKGTNRYWVQRKAYNYLLFDNSNVIRGEENNYISSYIYSGGLYTQYNDTIYSGCRTTINDTIKF